MVREIARILMSEDIIGAVFGEDRKSMSFLSILAINSCRTLWHSRNTRSSSQLSRFRLKRSWIDAAGSKGDQSGWLWLAELDSSYIGPITVIEDDSKEMAGHARDLRFENCYQPVILGSAIKVIPSRTMRSISRRYEDN